MRKALQEIRNHLREDIDKVDEPQLKAIFETSAEVIAGLEKAFSDYEQKNEAAWRQLLFPMVDSAAPPKALAMTTTSGGNRQTVSSIKPTSTTPKSPGVFTELVQSGL
jgi:hypothetical protein